MAEALGTGQAAPVSARTGKADSRTPRGRSATLRAPGARISTRRRRANSADTGRGEAHSRKKRQTPVPCWYNSRKVGQIIAYFAVRAGGSISALKATKLLYLADRRHMKDRARPLFHDNVVSMRHGPAHSITYDFITGIMEKEAGWSEFLRDRNGRSIAARKKFTRNDLDEINNTEMNTLKATWREFGRMDEWKVCDWVHRNCPEWEDPGNSSMPLPHERIFKHLEHPDATILAKEIEEERRIAEFWASL